MEESKQNQPSLNSEKGYTIFFVPFYFDEGDWEIIHRKKLSKWVRISEELYNEDILYPYIMEVFKQSTSNDISRLEIYEFKTKDEGINSPLFVDRILGKKQVALLAKNVGEQKNAKVLSFRLIDEKNFAPHLFISSTARIGIFTFSIELLDDVNADNHIILNYYLHKRNETNKYQCICLRPERQDEIPVPTNANSLGEMIPDLWRSNQQSTKGNIDYICWNFDDFVNCLLATMGRPKEGQKRIKYFSKERMHLFTFRSMMDVDNKLKTEDVTIDILRLSRCVNANYMLPVEQLIQQGSLLQTYENIYFSSSIEGAAMICVGKERNAEFVGDLHNKFIRQYLLVYILVLIQKYTLQSLERRIVEFESSGKQSDDEVWNLIKVICRIKVSCYYTDVSIYTHHSQFYQLCCNNLHIPETFTEIGEKVELLKLTTDKKIQEVLKQQQQMQQEAMTRHEQENEATERRQHLLNLVVAILTIAQVVQASYEIFAHWNELKMWTSIGLGIIGIVVLVIVMWPDLKRRCF